LVFLYIWEFKYIYAKILLFFNKENEYAEEEDEYTDVEVEVTDDEEEERLNKMTKKERDLQEKI
jgi:hypothetical protein